MQIEEEYPWAFVYMDFAAGKVSIYCEEYYDQVKECFSKMHPQLADQVPDFFDSKSYDMISANKNQKFYFFGPTSTIAFFCKGNGLKYRFIFPTRDGIRCKSDYVD